MKTTVRAVLVNQSQQCLLVQHNEWDPDNMGKWSTAGGRLERNETHELCLKRELVEEFGSSIAEKIKVGPKLHENTRTDRIDFFYAVWFSGEDVTVIARDEILDHKWCSLDEAKQMNLFFGFEADLFLKALSLVR
jgi:8-oxo-dGTP pyrophosphatase MutT (NUDIX family)